MTQKKELEIIQHTKMNSLELFLIEVTSRSPHGHDDLELGVIMEGSVTLLLEQESFLLHKGDIFLINRHQVHSLYRTNEKNLILAFQLHTEFYRQIDYSLEYLRFENNILHSGTVHRRLIPLLYQCASIYFQDLPFCALKCSGIMLDILYQLANGTHCHIATEKESVSAYHNTMRLNRIMDYIKEHYTEHISLQELSALENITDYHLSHFIKKMLGMSFQEYVGQLRFRHALTLMQKTDLNILDICMESGFSSSRYLNQMFEKNFHCTAKEYLKMQDKPEFTSTPLSADTIQKKYNNQQAIRYMKNIFPS